MPSNDDITPALAAQRSNRRDPEMEELLRQGRLLAQQQQGGEQPEADPAADAVRATVAPKPSSDWTVAGEAGKALVGGVRDAGQEVLNFVDDSANWLNDNFLNLRTQSQQAAFERGDKLTLPEAPANQTMGGNIARSITQFVVPFSAYLKAASRVGLLEKAGIGIKGAAAGAATDATAFDPHQKRLSNFILDITDQHPVIGESVFNYLASAPGDSNGEGRLKNVIEGLGLGAAGEMALRALKLFKATAVARGADPMAEVTSAAKAQKEAQAAAPAAAEDAAAGAEAAGAPARQGAEAVAEEPRLFADAHQPATEEAARLGPNFESALKQPEVAGIAPNTKYLNGVAVPEQIAKKSPSFARGDIDEMTNALLEGREGDIAKTLDKSDFNLSKLDNSEDVKGVIDSFSKVFEKQMDSAKRGVKTFTDIAKNADLLGMSTESYKGLFKDTDKLAERMFAHRVLMAGSAEKVKTLVPAAMSGDENAILALRKQVGVHASIMAHLKGAQTEIARAQSSMRMRVSSSNIDLALEERSALIDAMGGAKANVEFARQLQTISDLREFNDVARRAASANSPSKLYEAWVNGRLSNPVTHAANILGNSLAAIGSVAEKGVAAGIGGARNIMGRYGLVFRDPKSAISAGEVRSYAWGMMEGLKDSLRITGDGLKQLRDAAGAWHQGDVTGAERMIGESSDMGSAWKSFALNEPVLDPATSKIAVGGEHGPAISAQGFNLDPASNLGRAADYLGALVRAPGRALTTADDIFKAMFYRGELKAQAYRSATEKGLTGDALLEHINQVLADPPAEISAAAIKAAREGTFTTPLSGGFAKWAQDGQRTVPGLRYIVPFVRTPWNIMRYTFDRAPFLNMMLEQNRSILKAGGPQADMLMSRWATGGAIFALGAYLAKQGHIVGGGDKNQSAEKLGNVPQYSVRVDGKYYSFNRLDPFASMLGLAADFQKIAGHLDDESANKLAVAAVLSISRNIVSKTWLSGVTDILNAFNSDNGTVIGNYLNKQAATLVPFGAGLNQLRKEVDPEQKEVWDMMDSIKSQIPGFSKSVLPHVNLFGDDVHYEGGLGPDIASPVAQMTPNPEPGAAEIARLNVDLQHPMRQLATGNGSPAIPLNHQQYYRLMKILGHEAGGMGFKKAMNKLVSSSGWQDRPESQGEVIGAKELEIKSLYSSMKDAATKQLLVEDKELRTKFFASQQNRKAAITGQPIKPIN